LKAGEKQTVKFSLSKDELQFWNPQTKAWAVESGALMLGREDSTANLRSELTVTT
jgi:hypothetical protein